MSLSQGPGMAPSQSYEAAIADRRRIVRENTRDLGPERWIDLDGIRTRYFEKGEGAPVVFFHGGNIGSSSDAISARIWDLNLRSDLAQGKLHCS